MRHWSGISARIYSLFMLESNLDQFIVMTSCISRSFYHHSTSTVAKRLLGKLLVRVIPRPSSPLLLTGIITETEAYGSGEDPASHAYKGRKPRNSTMFGEKGVCYIYIAYGMHHCTNIVAYSGNKDAGAVLIRSIFPVRGIKQMMKNRKINKLSDLANGPGKLSTAMMIDRSLNGVDVTDFNSFLYIVEGIETSRVWCTPRIGISAGKELNWRFVLLDDVNTSLGMTISYKEKKF
jgi:DNA-3-methyladenine glycosylase